MSGAVLARARAVVSERGPRGAAAAAIEVARAHLEHLAVRRRGPQPFRLDGVEHTQLVHPHNRTWRNERAVEVPLALAFLDRHPGPALEVGNVLGHYGRTGHVVVDRYEQAPGVLNVDVVDYQPEAPFGAIVAVSTLEHVGWDEEPRDPDKIPRAMEHLRRMLLPAGRLLVTCPLSYNPHLDALVAADALGTDHQAFLVREQQQWSQVDRATAFDRAEMDRYGGRAVWVAELSPW